MLRQVTNQPPASTASRRLTQHRCAAGSLANDAQQNFDKSRFASAVGTKQAEDLALVDVERDVGQGLKSLFEHQTFRVGFAKRFGIDRHIGTTIRLYRYRRDWF